jgi:hypothetical protein
MADPYVIDALLPVADALEALDVRYYVGGSVASSVHGVARASIDADVVAELRRAHVGPLVARLEDRYYIPVDRLRVATTNRASCNFIHLATAFKIDIFVSKERPFDRSAAERARPQYLDEGHNRRAFPVSSREDVLLAKLEWFRRCGETSERQWWDVVGLLRVGDLVDWGYVAHWARELGVEDLVARARGDALST